MIKPIRLTKLDVQNKVEELKLFASKQWNIKVDFNIVYDLESMNIVGSFSPRTNTMRLNKFLLEEFGNVYIDEVLVHEFAHVVVRKLFPSNINKGKKVNSHGKEFKDVCRALGIRGKATTDAFIDSKYLKNKRESKPSKNNKFPYKCGCKEINQVSKTLHKRMLSGIIYSCNKCKQNLVSCN